MKTLDASLLAYLPPFLDMERQELDELLSQASSARYEKGRYIFEQRQDAHSFFLLLDGHIRVVKVTPHGEQVIVRYISSGELFGIAQAIGKNVYPANAIAAVDCVVMSWPTTSWKEIIRIHPTFAANTYATIGSRLQDTQNRLVELATERAEQRVAGALLRLINQTGKTTDEGVMIDFPISRQDISEMTGTTLHTVSRLLSSWEQDGWIKSGRKKITVTRGNQLAVIANKQK